MKDHAGGLIDTNLLPALLELFNHVTIPQEQRQQMKRWFGDLGVWFCESELGKEEASMPNNHAVWHLAQAVAFLRFAQQEDQAISLLKRHATRLATEQIAPDGSQPEELTRTLSYNYSVYNLYGWCMIAFQAQQLKVSLDQTYYDRIIQAVDFMIPF